MPEKHGLINAFVEDLRKRVNRHRLWTTLVWAVVVGAAALVATGLWFTIPGYAVPVSWIGWIVGLATVGGLAFWAWRRLSIDRAATFTDRFFRLQDTVASYLHFSKSKQQNGYFALQAEQTSERISKLDPTSVPYEPPRRGMLLAAGLVAVALPLSLRGPSEAVQQQQLLEEVTVQKTTEINEELIELVEKLREEVKDPLEKELVDPDKLRKWVDELSASKDQKEALRQYARLERKLNKARMATQRKRDEQLLDRAAEQLDRDQQAKPLAKNFQQKQYDQAAKKLTKMQPQAGKSLSQQRRALARLKAVSQRMAAAARSQAGKRSSPGSSKAKQQGKPSAGAQASASSSSSTSHGGMSSGGGGMAQAMEDLAQAVSEFDDSLKAAERQESEQGECSADKKSNCQSCQKSVSDRLGKLCDKLNRLSIMRRANKKLGRLSKKCSSCQGELCQACAACQSPNAGGKKPGWGSNTARRDAEEELVDNGQTTQLKGTKGNGPSLKSVEAADDGSGVSTQEATQRSRNYQKQFESFVQREDVPEQVKQGVKRYFEVIHGEDDGLINDDFVDGETTK